MGSADFVNREWELNERVMLIILTEPFFNCSASSVSLLVLFDINKCIYSPQCFCHVQPSSHDYEIGLYVCKFVRMFVGTCVFMCL